MMNWINRVPRQKWIEGGLAALALLLTVGAAASLINGAAAWRAQPDSSDQQAGHPAGGRDSASTPPRIQQAVQRIDGRYLFFPTRPSADLQGHFVGVLGQKAVFSNGEAVPVGGSFMDATVLAVGPDWVEVEHEGQKKKLWVFGRDRSGHHEQGPPSQTQASGGSFSGQAGSREEAAQRFRQQRRERLERYRRRLTE